MGRLLEALRTAATPATLATLPPAAPGVSQSRKSRNGAQSEGGAPPVDCVAESQLPQGVPFDAAGMRARLLDCAQRLGGDLALIQCLPEADLAAFAGTPDQLLCGFVELMMEAAERAAGRVPSGHTAAILCARCGPVWAHPSVAAALPVVGGWPRALGCPWCHVRNAGGCIPRP